MNIRFLAISICSCLILSCTAGKKVTVAVSLSPAPQSRVFVGGVTNELSKTTPHIERPTLADIDMLRQEIGSALTTRGIFQMGSQDSADFIVRGAITDYERGSGWARALIPFSGASSVRAHIDVVDVRSGEIVFAGEFSGKHDGWPASGKKCFNNIARQFAKELKSQIKTIEMQGAVSKP